MRCVVADLRFEYCGLFAFGSDIWGEVEASNRSVRRHGNEILNTAVLHSSHRSKYPDNRQSLPYTWKGQPFALDPQRRKNTLAIGHLGKVWYGACIVRHYYRLHDELGRFWKRLL